MSRCSCSTRALELFVQDFAGFGLRQQSIVRQLRPFPRQLEPQRSIRFFSARTAGVRQAAASTTDLGNENGSHTERVVGNVSETVSINGNEGGEAKPQQETNGDSTDTVDSVRLRGLEMEALRPQARVPMLQMERFSIVETPERMVLGKGKLREEVVEVPSARAISRVKRKLRRMEAGIWLPSASSGAAAVTSKGVEGDKVVEGLESVLDKIDGMEGPKVQRKQVKVYDAERKSQDGTEKKLGKNAKKKEKKKKEEGKAAASKTPDTPPPKKEPWAIQKKALAEKFGAAGWAPRKRLSPDTLEGIRTLHASDPTTFTTETLAQNFQISPEAIRRVLRSKWKPNERELDDRRVRWERRGVKKWQDMAEKGIRPPARWRAMGIGGQNGLKEEKVPKRKKKRNEDGLDNTVAELYGVSDKIL